MHKNSGEITHVITIKLFIPYSACGPNFLKVAHTT